MTGAAYGGPKNIENAESALMCDSATPLFSVTGLFQKQKTWVNQLVS
jgi:hypothetical protein